jgi:hypothetical protein
MPGTNFGPVKPTPIKRGIPTKMSLAPDVAAPKPTMKPQSKPGSKSQSKPQSTPMRDTLAKMKKIGTKPKSKMGTGLGKPKMPAGTGTGMNGLSGL